MKKSKVNFYELDVIQRYLPDIGLDQEKIGSGNYSLNECITHNKHSIKQSRALKSLESASLIDIQIVVDALNSCTVRARTLPLITILNATNKRNDVGGELLNCIVSGIDVSQGHDSSSVCGVVRDTIEDKLDELSDDNLILAFNVCNDLSSSFTNASTTIYSSDPIYPIADSLRKIHDKNDLSTILTNNQALIGLIRRSFEGGLQSLHSKDTDNLGIDDLLDLIEANDEPDNLVVDFIINEGELVGKGVHAEGISKLAKEILKISKSGCRLKLTASDTMLISDLLFVLSRTIKNESDSDRKALLSDAVISLVEICYKPILNKNEGKCSIYKDDPKQPKSWLKSEMFHNIASNAQYTQSGCAQADKAISEYYYAILINIASAEEYVDNRYRFSPLTICGNSISNRCSDYLKNKGSLNLIKREDRLNVVSSIIDEDLKKIVLNANTQIMRSSFERDLGI